MAIMKDAAWARHTSPWSVWTRFVGGSLLFVALYNHLWWVLVGVGIFLIINPFLFPEPESKKSWASRSVLGERLWTQKWHWDFPMAISTLGGLFAVLALLVAYFQLFWPTVILVALVLALKAFFLHLMVRLYDDQRRKHWERQYGSEYRD